MEYVEENREGRRRTDSDYPKSDNPSDNLRTQFNVNFDRLDETINNLLHRLQFILSYEDERDTLNKMTEPTPPTPPTRSPYEELELERLNRIHYADVKLKAILDRITI